MEGELSSFDEYISRCKPEQKDIYYLVAPSRDLAMMSPYLETFEKNGIEVIIVYSAIDDFVMGNLKKYSNRKLVSCESGGIDLDNDKDKKSDDENDEKKSTGPKLTDDEAEAFCTWFKEALPDKVENCKTTKRLNSSPAVVTDHESGALRRMLKMVDTQDGNAGSMGLPKQSVEINPEHPVILGLYQIRHKEPKLAKVCAEQIFDNCLVAAGLLDDGRSMLPRLNEILEGLIKSADDEKSSE